MLSWILPAWSLFYDFENKAQLGDWEIIGGDWEIEDGVLKGENVPAAPGFDHGPGIVIGEDTWTDYVFELKMKMEEEKLGGPIIRYIDEQNWYCLKPGMPSSTFAPT